MRVHQPAALIRTKLYTVYYISHRCVRVCVCVRVALLSHAHTSRRCAIRNLAVGAVKATNFVLTLISRTVPKKEGTKEAKEGDGEKRESAGNFIISSVIRYRVSLRPVAAVITPILRRVY